MVSSNPISTLLTPKSTLNHSLCVTKTNGFHYSMSIVGRAATVADEIKYGVEVGKFSWLPTDSDADNWYEDILADLKENLKV